MSAHIEFDTVPQLFRRLCETYRDQDRTLLRYKEREDGWQDLSVGDVERRVHALAGYLHDQGVRAGDRVAILSENRPEWVVADQAAQALGGANVTIYTSLPPAKIAYILRDSQAKVLVVSVPVQRKKVEEILDECPHLKRVIVMSEVPEEAPEAYVPWEKALEAGAAVWADPRDRLAGIAEEVEPHDVSSLIYTSGTTGEPKGVVLSHRNFCSNVKAALERFPIGPSDHHLSFLPLAHAFERTCGYLAMLASAATISYAESVEAVSQNLLEVQPTVMISVPRMFEKVYSRVIQQASEGGAVKQKVFDWAVRTGKRHAREAQNGSAGPILKAQNALAQRLVFSTLHEKLGGNLRFAVSGGAALPEKIGTFFQAAGVTIVEGYGLTETAPIMTANPLDAPRYGTVGHVLPGVTVAIQRLDDNEIVGTVSGNDYPTRVTTGEGEILVQGPNVMGEYWKRPEETRSVFDPDGWFHTGDVGRFEDGYLQITDRIKHLIVSRGGKNIYPGPIEDVFKTQAWFDQVMVVGEDRPFLTALVVPDFESVRMKARDLDIQESDYSDEELIEVDDVQAMFDQAFTAYNRDASAHEKIRDFHLVAEPFSVEAGTLTPTMKLKRRVITDRYEDEIDAMYAKFERRGA